MEGKRENSLSKRATSDLSVRPYKKEFDYSYTLGAFPTMELLLTRAEIVKEVYIHSKYEGNTDVRQLCDKNNIPVQINDKVLNKISSKENCFVSAVFEKYKNTLESDKNHVVLVNPSDMGNVGTIIRTILGFGIKNLAVITPSCDLFHPKTIRASMGALFKINFEFFDSFHDYEKKHGDRDFFPFMLDGEKTLSVKDCPRSDCFSLIFGNEATGLSSEFSKVGQSIFIPQSLEIDSLNLPVSVAVGTFLFMNKN